MAKQKFDMGRVLLKTLFVAIIAGLLSFLQGALLSLLVSLSAGFVNVMQAVFGAVWITVGTTMRKGVENFGETMMVLSYVGVVFVILARMPFQIPLIQYAIEWSLEGFILAVGTIWLSEALAQNVMKMFGVKG